MGDLFEKKVGNYHGHSNPSDHGFEEWFTSQAQLPTSTPNCGCFPPANWQPPDKERSTAKPKLREPKSKEIV